MELLDREPAISDGRECGFNLVLRPFDEALAQLER
jgi:hypothetical protein